MYASGCGRQDGGLTIKEGGQLLHNSLGVNLWATVEKSISHYTVASGAGSSNGWYFIASPIYTGFTPDATMLSNTYDLYRLNGNTWENFKAHDEFTELVRGQGYLYANNTDVTLKFTGHLIPYKSVVANHTNRVNVYDGWNLMGNPFVCNAYASQPYYKMNVARTGIVAVEDYWNTDNYIAPCTGFVVHADADGAVWLTHTPPEATASSDHGSLQIALAQATNERSAEQIDNAIVSFNEGIKLEKFYFGEQAANIFIPQNGDEYAIAFSNRQDEVPVNFKANETGTYTINFDGTDLNNIKLIDKFENLVIDLNENNSYTFMGSPADNRYRFVIVFKSSELSDNSEIFAYQNGNGNIIVNGDGTLQVFDMLGRKLFSREIHSDFSLPTSDFSASGVYVLRLIQGDKVNTQKMVIE